MKIRSLVIALVSLGMLLSHAAFAGSKKKPTAPATVQPPTITAVAADSITVKDAQGTRTLTITQFTEIIVNGRKAPATELKPGMTVNVTLGTDPTKVSRINASGK